jgi:hypothetical protein
MKGRHCGTYFSHAHVQSSYALVCKGPVPASIPEQQPEDKTMIYRT